MPTGMTVADGRDTDMDLKLKFISFRKAKAEEEKAKLTHRFKDRFP